jgi:hypothetical protein
MMPQSRAIAFLLDILREVRALLIKHDQGTQMGVDESHSPRFWSRLRKRSDPGYSKGVTL